MFSPEEPLADTQIYTHILQKYMHITYITCNNIKYIIKYSIFIVYIYVYIQKYIHTNTRIHTACNELV